MRKKRKEKNEEKGWGVWAKGRPFYEKPVKEGEMKSDDVLCFPRTIQQKE